MSEIDLLRKIERLEQRLDALVANGESGRLSWLRLGGLATGRLEARQFTLANLAVGQLPSVAGNGAGTIGLVFIFDNGGDMAIYRIGGALNQVSEIADPTGVFSTTAGTASRNNIYWSAGNSRYEIENQRGASRTYTVLLFVDA